MISNHPPNTLELTFLVCGELVSAAVYIVYQLWDLPYYVRPLPESYRLPGREALSAFNSSSLTEAGNDTCIPISQVTSFPLRNHTVSSKRRELTTAQRHLHTVYCRSQSRAAGTAASVCLHRSRIANGGCTWRKTRRRKPYILYLQNLV